MRLVRVVISTRSSFSTHLLDLREHVVHLRAHRPHLDLRIDEPCRAHELLDHLAGVLGLVTPGGCRDEDHLRRQLLPLLELQRPVIERRGQAKAVLHQHFLARAIAAVHGAQLRDGLVALVDEEERVFRQVVEQARRRLARGAAGKIARVVLDAGAVADLLHHFHVEHRALLQPLRLEQLAGLAQLLQAHTQLLADLVHRADQALARA